MKISEKDKQIPDEFKQLAKDFSENGFITTSFLALSTPIPMLLFSIHK